MLKFNRTTIFHPLRYSCREYLYILLLRAYLWREQQTYRRPGENLVEPCHDGRKSYQSIWKVSRAQIRWHSCGHFTLTECEPALPASDASRGKRCPTRTEALCLATSAAQENFATVGNAALDAAPDSIFGAAERAPAALQAEQWKLWPGRAVEAATATTCRSLRSMACRTSTQPGWSVASTEIGRGCSAGGRRRTASLSARTPRAGKRARSISPRPCT